MREEGVVFHRFSKLLGRYALLIGIEQDREAAVCFEYGVFDGREIADALRPQLFDELIEREAIVTHRVLLHLAV